MNIDNLITGVIVTIASAIVAHIVKGYIFDLKEQLKNHKDDVNKKVSQINERLDKVQDGYSQVLNEILLKFSHWEDRIKKIINDIVMTNYKSSSIGDFLDSVENQLIKTESEEIVSVIKNEIKELENDLNELSSKMDEGELKLRNVDARTRENYYDLLKYTKNSIFEIKEKIKSIEYLINNDLKRSNDLLNKLYLVSKKLNEDFLKFKVYVDKKFEVQSVKIKLK